MRKKTSYSSFIQEIDREEKYISLLSRPPGFQQRRRKIHFTFVLHEIYTEIYMKYIHVPRLLTYTQLYMCHVSLHTLNYLQEFLPEEFYFSCRIMITFKFGNSKIFKVPKFYVKFVCKIHL